jgi:IS30 family transposase
MAHELSSGTSMREIARMLKRAAATISRERQPDADTSDGG